MTHSQAREVKLVAAGDGAVGKTCLLMTYAHNKFNEGYVPTVFDTYDMEVLVEGQSVRRKFSIIEMLSYSIDIGISGIDCYIILTLFCFSWTLGYCRTRRL